MLLSLLSVDDKAPTLQISLKLQPLKLSGFTPNLRLPDLASRYTDAQLNWNLRHAEIFILNNIHYLSEIPI